MSDYRLVVIRRDTRPSVEQALQTTLNEAANAGFELHTAFPYGDSIFVITAWNDDGTAPQVRTQHT